MLRYLLTAAIATFSSSVLAQGVDRNFAGSMQIDYLLVPTEDVGRELALDGATAELSMKLAMDFGDHVSANVKVCYACHGFEVGMAFFDLRYADELNLRVGRFTPSFGDFPLRHDPANHRTSDKPLIYDMGRMLQLEEWNMSILPAPWVDNGLEINGSHFWGSSAQIDYALYAIGGPKGLQAATDFDYRLSRSRDGRYVDNNSRPTVGARLALTALLGAMTLTAGGSFMAGTYDPDNALAFQISGLDVTLASPQVTFRAEYLSRRTEMDLGADPASRFKYGPDENGRFDEFFVKDGGYAEVEIPLMRLDLVLRGEAMRRRGNVLADSPMSDNSTVVRTTAAIAYRVHGALRLKSSAEYYDFGDFENEVALHLGLAGPF